MDEKRKNIIKHAVELRNSIYIDGEEALNQVSKYIERLKADNKKLREELKTFNSDEKIQEIQNKFNNYRKMSIGTYSEKEKEALDKFRGEHYRKCKGNTTITLEGTGIGVGITVKCKKCGTIEDITDIDSW